MIRRCIKLHFDEFAWHHKCEINQIVLYDALYVIFVYVIRIFALKRAI